jgi:hypothetical protein
MSPEEPAITKAEAQRFINRIRIESGGVSDQYLREIRQQNPDEFEAILNLQRNAGAATRTYIHLS